MNDTKKSIKVGWFLNRPSQKLFEENTANHVGRSKNHEVYSQKVNKPALYVSDDKRRYMNDIEKEPERTFFNQNKPRCYMSLEVNSQNWIKFRHFFTMQNAR